MKRNFAIVLWVLCAASFAADKSAKAKGEASAGLSDANPAAAAQPRHETWLEAHRKREARLQEGKVEVLLIGDSITAGWSKQPELIQKFFGDLHVVNLGQPADKTENILWRLQHHSFDRIAPSVAIVMAGTNNSNHDEYTPEQIAGGVRAIVTELRQKLPRTKILLLGIFPRGSHDQRVELKKGRITAGLNPQWAKIDAVNRMLPAIADGREVVYLNINRAFLNEKGELPVDVMPDLLHPNEKGYEVWGRTIQPTIAEMLSPTRLPNAHR